MLVHGRALGRMPAKYLPRSGEGPICAVRKKKVKRTRTASSPFAKSCTGTQLFFNSLKVSMTNYVPAQ